MTREFTNFAEYACKMTPKKATKEHWRGYCNQLQQENTQLKARIARLEGALNHMIKATDNLEYEGGWMDNSRRHAEDALEESPQQSLVELQADAAKVMIGSLKWEIRFGQGFIKVSDAYKYIEQLRNSIKDGE